MVLGPPRRAKAARARSARPATCAVPPGSWRPAGASGVRPALTAGNMRSAAPSGEKWYPGRYSEGNPGAGLTVPGNYHHCELISPGGRRGLPSPGRAAGGREAGNGRRRRPAPPAGRKVVVWSRTTRASAGLHSLVTRPEGRRTVLYEELLHSYPIAPRSARSRLVIRGGNLLREDLAGLLANARGGHPEDDYMSLPVL
jgi:hypothetical protein